MSNHKLEKKGIEILKGWLIKNNRVAEESDSKTFDLKVDGVYAEVKTKGGAWGEFDFISMTSNQKAEIDAQESFKIFIVLGVNTISPEVIEIDSKDLQKIPPKVITSYEWNKSHLKKFRHITT